MSAISGIQDNNKSNNNNRSPNKFTVMARNGYSAGGLFRFVLPALLLLQCCHVRPTIASAVSKIRTESNADHDHCVVVLENSPVRKEIGSVWVSSQNPCAIHACEADGQGGALEIINEEDCGQFYCDVDSELRPTEGTCCGTCVKTKCRSNDTIYSVGKTWHNKDDCTLYECTLLGDGQPMINAYQKTCPPLPANCPQGNIIEVECCPYCKTNNEATARLGETDEDIWTEEFYRKHPCARDCQATEPAKTCHYTFVVEWYQTLSKACFDCPHNGTDCDRPHCIPGDGIPRSLTVVNRMMPGPSIEVCQNDLIVVDVRNHLLGESTTMHWHGMHQKDTPYMDGVPHISQCPISPHAAFRYSFRAENVGTHFWHSHTGMQRGDGVFGALIIRRPRAMEPHAHLYDFDLTEHKMIVQDWVHETGVSMFSAHHHSRGDNKPPNILINGRGRFYKGIWEAAKVQQSGRGGSLPETETARPIDDEVSSQDQHNPEETFMDAPLGTDYDKDVDYLHPLDHTDRINMRLKESNEISRLARLARLANNSEALNAPRNESESENSEENIEHTTQPAVPSTITLPPATVSATEEYLPTPINRTRRSAPDYQIPLSEMPLQIFHVRRSFRYRFRIINAEFLNCPIAISIDNHTLTAINSDGYDFEAVDVGSIVTYAGERFDFVLHTNQTIGNYWVRLKGLMDCSEVFTSAFQVAILRYEDAALEEPSGEVGYHHKAEGIELNVMNQGPGAVDALTIAELTALPSYDSVPGLDRDALKPVADYKFFVYYDFYAKDNPVFHPADYYGFNASTTKTNNLFTPQLNHISLKFPSVALLPSRNELDDSMFCNETSLLQQGIDCRKEFCKCHHVLQVPLNAVVEFIIIDEGFTFDANHPFHLHGNAFRVVGLERLGANVTVEMVKQLDRYNLLKRNLIRPPVKDTVTVPDGGYTIIRFEAYNPGFWLFHCHIEFHAEIGMALVLKVGNNDEMLPVPKNFPTCHDYMPETGSNDAPEGQGNQQQQQQSTTTMENERSTAAKVTATAMNVLVLFTVIQSILFHLIV